MRALSPAFTAAGTLADGAACFDLAAERTSVSVTRPSGPVPFTLERSTPSSAAIRRATGDAFTRASSGCGGSRAGCAGDTPASTGSFFLLFRLRRFLALTTDECDLVADVYLATFLDVNFGKRPILRRFPFHRRLVCLDFGEHFASRNLIALLFLPRDESALGHRVAQLGHLDFRHGIR